jgi:hypothetical protein
MGGCGFAHRAEQLVGFEVLEERNVSTFGVTQLLSG